METQTIRIQGFDFTAPAPFEEGYALKANEASAMNQLLAENLRNNWAGKIKTAKEKAEKEGGSFPAGPAVSELSGEISQAEFDTYAAQYEFGARRVGGGDSSLPKDPIEREAHMIARQKVRAKAKEKNYKLDADAVAAMATKWLSEEKFAPAAAKMREEARRRVESMSELSIEDLEMPEPEAHGAEGQETSSSADESQSHASNDTETEDPAPGTGDASTEGRKRGRRG